MDAPKYLLVNSMVLPDVFLRVLVAKNLLAKGRAKNSSEASRMAGISRSAFYKYKDSIHEYDPHLSDNMMTLYFSLEDEPGVLSSVINSLYTLGANIITINQNIPIDGVAPVTISIRLGNSTSTPEHLKATLSALSGVVKVKEI